MSAIAYISAQDYELKNSGLLAEDAELPHFGLEGGPFKAESLGSAPRPGNYPAGFTEGLKDVLALSVPKGKRNAANVAA